MGRGPPKDILSYTLALLSELTVSFLPYKYLELHRHHSIMNIPYPPQGITSTWNNILFKLLLLTCMQLLQYMYQWTKTFVQARTCLRVVVVTVSQACQLSEQRWVYCKWCVYRWQDSSHSIQACNESCWQQCSCTLQTVTWLRSNITCIIKYSWLVWVQL